MKDPTNYQKLVFPNIWSISEMHWRSSTAMYIRVGTSSYSEYMCSIKGVPVSYVEYMRYVYDEVYDIGRKESIKEHQELSCLINL